MSSDQTTPGPGPTPAHQSLVALFDVRTRLLNWVAQHEERLRQLDREITQAALFGTAAPVAARVAVRRSFTPALRSALLDDSQRQEFIRLRRATLLDDAELDALQRLLDNLWLVHRTRALELEATRQRLVDDLARARRDLATLEQNIDLALDRLAARVLSAQASPAAVEEAFTADATRWVDALATEAYLISLETDPARLALAREILPPHAQRVGERDPAAFGRLCSILDRLDQRSNWTTEQRVEALLRDDSPAWTLGNQQRFLHTIRHIDRYTNPGPDTRPGNARHLIRLVLAAPLPVLRAAEPELVRGLAALGVDALPDVTDQLRQRLRTAFTADGFARLFPEG